MPAATRLLRRNLLAITLAFSTSGCDFECARSDSSSSPAIPTISYPNTALVLWETLALAAQVPTTQNLNASRFSISPPLPDGLTFATADGSIEGTPTTPQAQATYRIDGLNGEGVSLTYTLVRIEILPAQAPSGLSYSPASAAVAVGEPLAPMVASVRGPIESFTVAPALPAGLNLDSQTGRIAGTCTGGGGLSAYQVTASNPFGSAEASVSIEVLAGSVKRSLLVASTGDLTVDVFDTRGAGMAPIDAVYANSAPRAVAPTSDGRWVFIANEMGRLLRCARDPVSARLGDPVDLGDVGSVRRLAITSDRRFVIAAGDGFVTRYELGIDGEVCCPVQTGGPFAPSALQLAGDSLAIVASSAPGQLRVYELEPTLTQRGATLDLGANVTIAALENFESGVSFYAATSTYSETLSSFAGVLRRLRISSPAELQAGAAALVESQAFNVGRQLSAVRARGDSSGLRELLVVDRTLAQLQVWELNAAGAFVGGSLRAYPLAGTPSLLEVGTNPTKFWVLDENFELLRQYSMPVANSNATPELEFEIRTRRQPSAIVPVRSPAAIAVVEQAFVTSAGDASLRALESTPGSIGAIRLAAQGPVSTAASPRDVEAHPRLNVVYTANADAESVGVYSCNPADLSMSLLEEQALAAGARPIALALSPAGRHLYALSETGRVHDMRVDALTGELSIPGGLTVQGSMLGGRLRADRLGRFLFVVQPAAGRVTSLTVNLPTGALLISNFDTSLPRPIDLWTSADGRFAYVLDEQLASVFSYSIERVSGSLVSLGASVGLGGSPTRLASNSPADALIAPLGGLATRDFLALDGPLAQWQVLSRAQATGQLLNSTEPAFSHPAEVVEIARMTPAESVTPFNLLAIDGPSGSRLVSGYNTPNSVALWNEISSEPLGAGPHALATRVRMR
jgi:hypothetical protein